MPFPLVPGMSYMTWGGKVVSVHVLGNDGVVQITGSPRLVYSPVSFIINAGGPTLEARVFSGREDEYDLMYPIVPEYEEV